MATKLIKPNARDYTPINRGTSLTIPVIIKDIDDKPINLTELRVVFTLKKLQGDFDQFDRFAYIRKDFAPQEPEAGKFFIFLSSVDTDLPWGSYFFDVELRHPINGMIHRLCIFAVEIIQGPSNRWINPGIGQMPIGPEITIVHLNEGTPIIIVAPMLPLSPSLYGPIADLLNTTKDLQDKNDDLNAIIATLEDRIAYLETFHP